MYNKRVLNCGISKHVFIDLSHYIIVYSLRHYVQLFFYSAFSASAFSALTQIVGQQKGHLACKN